MAEKKETKKEVNVEARFTKQQIITSETYKHRVDLLSVLLVDDKLYTHKEVLKLVDDFMKGKVE